MQRVPATILKNDEQINAVDRLLWAGPSKLATQRIVAASVEDLPQAGMNLSKSGVEIDGTGRFDGVAKGKEFHHSRVLLQGDEGVERQRGEHFVTCCSIYIAHINARQMHS